MRYDLNLLPVFVALLEERSVTRAAQRLGITQPALSNALARLRVTLRDPLFVRERYGLNINNITVCNTSAATENAKVAGRAHRRFSQNRASPK